MPPYVASGTYGCVFKPFVKCSEIVSTKKPKYMQTVGKVFSNEKEALEEFEIQKRILEKIDPKSEFTAKLIEKCVVNDFVRSDELYKCPYEFTQHPIQLIYEYGGLSYDHLLKNNKPSMQLFKKLLKGLEAVFWGVVKIHEARYVHQDIKPHNILYSNRHKHAILIDFGISKPVHHIYHAKNDYILKHAYPYFPPEYKLKFVRRTGDFKEYKRLVLQNFGTNALKEVKDVMMAAGVDFQGDLEMTYKHRYRDSSKIDSYSLGVVLAMLLKWMQLPKDSQMLKTLYNLIQVLCHQDSKKRVGVTEAAHLYSNFLRTTRFHMTR